MEALFLKLVNLSINAGWLVLVVMLARVVFRRCPKWVFCLLWGIVALRLLCPFTLESSLSLMPSAEPLPKEIIYTAQPQIQSGITSIDNAINPVLSDMLGVPENAGVSVYPAQIWSFLLACLWAVGAGLMLVYGFVSTVMLRLRLSTATLLEKGIKQSEWIDTPIVFGFLRPTIYLPYRLNERDTAYVIAHERAHIQRKDHLWKALGFLLLSVYWFHPLMWCAYLLFGRDVEGACDEKVIREMEKAEKRAYSMALLNCSTNRRQKLVYPLAFGEISVKERVSNVMNYKKPAFWVVVVAIVGCIALAVGFLTSPKGRSDTTGYATFTTGNMLSITLPKELSLVPTNEYRDEPTRERFYLEEPHPVKEKQYALSEWAWFSAGWVDVVRKDSDWMGVTDNGEPILNGQNHCEYSDYTKTDYGWMCSFDCDLYTNGTVQNVEQERSFWCYIVDGEDAQCWLFLAKDTYDQSFAGKIAKSIHLEKNENPSLDEGEAQVPAKFRAEEALFYFFAGFSKGDYASMRDYCTEDFQQTYFHKEDVFGMKTAEIQEMTCEEQPNGFFRFMVDVSMEPSEMSALYPETSTSFYVHVAKVNDKWLIDGLSTDGFFDGVVAANEIEPPSAELSAKLSDYKNLSPSDIHSVSEIAVKIEDGTLHRVNDPQIIQRVIETLSGAEEIKGTGCPFATPFYLIQEDGTTGVIYPATDSCAVFWSNGSYYDYGDGDNLEFWNLLGLRSETGKVYLKEASSETPLLTEGKAAYQASLKARAYIEFHKDEFPDADYDSIEPVVTAELMESEEFSARVYKVNVKYPVPDAENYPAFELLIDADSGDTLKTTVLKNE